MSVLRFSMADTQLCSPRHPEGILLEDISMESFGNVEDERDFNSVKLDHFLREFLNENVNGGLNLGRICLMIHDYGYDPVDRVGKLKKSQNPHRRLFIHRQIEAKKSGKIRAWSWPAALHLSEDALEKTAGLGLAIGWKSSGEADQFLADFYSEILSNATLAAKGIAQLLSSIHRLMPETPVHFFAHGIGSEVIFSCFEHLLPHNPQILHQVHSVQLLGPSVNRPRALSLLEQIDSHLPKSQISFYNYMNPEDDHLNLIYENSGIHRNERIKVLGLHGAQLKRHPRWLELQLNHPMVRWWMRRKLKMDIRVNDPENVRDHTMFFRHIPNMILFRQIFWGKEGFNIEGLRSKDIPEGPKGLLLATL